MSRGAPIGALVEIYYDSPIHKVERGDVIRTTSGRCYRAEYIRIQQRGVYTGRQHIKAMVIDPEDVSETDTVHPLHWYPRG